MERLSNIFKKKYGTAPDSIVTLRSDGSDRKIYRLFSGEQSYIGIIGDAIAFDHLLYSGYLDYPASVKRAAREALNNLKSR